MSNNAKLRQIIYDKIVDEISSGKIVVGERLNERELAKKFNASRTPVREALIQLEKVGVIVINHNKGAMVRKVTIKQFKEILDIISALEGYAVEIIVAKGITSKDLIYIKQIGKKMEMNAKNKEYFKFADNNRIFHEYLVKITKNLTLQTLLKELNSRIYTGGLTVPFYIDDYEEKHKIIIDAISKGLSKEAGIAMKQHNQDIIKYVVETLKILKGTKTISF